MRVLQLGVILCLESASNSPLTYSFLLVPRAVQLLTVLAVKCKTAHRAAAEREEATAGLETRARLSDVAVVCCPREGGDTVEGLLLAEAGRISQHCTLVRVSTY